MFFEVGKCRAFLFACASRLGWHPRALLLFLFSRPDFCESRTARANDTGPHGHELRSRKLRCAAGSLADIRPSEMHVGMHLCVCARKPCLQSFVSVQLALTLYRPSTYKTMLRTKNIIQLNLLA